MCMIVFAVRRMTAPESLRHQILDGFPDEFVLSMTKEFAGTRVCRTDCASGIRDNYGVWRDLKEIFQRRMSELGPVVPSRSRCVLFRGIRRAHPGSNLIRCNDTRFGCRLQQISVSPLSRIWPVPGEDRYGVY